MSGFLTSYLDHLSYKDPRLLLLPDLQSGTDASSPVGCEAFISTSLPYQTVEDTYTGTFMQSVCETHLIETGKQKKKNRPHKQYNSYYPLLLVFFIRFPPSRWHSLTHVSHNTVRCCLRNNVHVTDEDVFAWRTLFKAVLHALQFYLSPVVWLEGKRKRQGAENIWCTVALAQLPEAPLLSSLLLSVPLQDTLWTHHSF